MNRPRESVLNLFDPLASANSAPTTPLRHTASSPTLSSDKENAAPSDTEASPITLTKFFNRTYTRYKALPPKLPKGGLIDFGDITITDEMDLDELDEMSQAKEDVTVVLSHGMNTAATPQRRPLADIALGDGDGDETPKPAKTVPPVSDAAVFKLSRPSAAPASSPLAAVINAINGVTSSPPHISVIPPEPSSPSPTRPAPRPRPSDGSLSTSTSSLDPRRTSTDLHTSFQMHFPDASFDLLNDKISFFGNDSLSDVDMDMDVEEAAMMALARKIEAGTVKAEESDGGNMASSESEGEMDVDEALAGRLRDIHLGTDSESEDENAKENYFTPIPSRRPTSSIVSISRSAPTAPAPVRQFVRRRSNASPSRAHKQTSLSNAQQAGLRTPPPLVAKAAPVKALQVVKKGTYAPSRPRASSSSCAPVVLSSAPATATVFAVPRVPMLTAMSRPRAPVVGVQRPPAGAAVPVRVKAPPSTTTGLRGPRTTSVPSRAVGSHASTSGPLRPPVATAASAVMGPTSRLHRSTSVAAPAGKNLGSGSASKPLGLRPPSRTAAGSARPTAASKLPSAGSLGPARSAVNDGAAGRFGFRRT
ncbi:hypothetical protein FA95DRAFT_1553640 [Auriscalpium vulgare]|uniref:Uncharacterized protein n=1 Tax=Auriscalpium vulgare TaxID=40419 RepID=A0ACB8S856_9AGAM|nr:hypothetical protein FA95DRAFT_1553640 [Auriscalpium vulgare]